MKKSLNETNILAALKQVNDPDLNRDIVSLNFIKNLTISNSNITFTIELTTPACPLKEQIKAAAIKAIRDNIEGVNEITIELSSHVRSDSIHHPENLLPGVKNTIAIASGKGGVGKSTIAVNLAVSLALDGAKVGLLDADMYGPSIPLMMGINKLPELSNKKLIPLKAHYIKVMSIGFLIDAKKAVIWRGPLVSGALKQFLSDVLWGELDYLVFDLPPGTGDIHLTLIQSIPLTGAVIVTTPQDIALADARKASNLFQEVNVPILGIIENMSYYVCSKCNHKEEIFAAGGGSKTAKELHIPFLGSIPIYTQIRIGSDIGKPIVILEPESELSKIVRDIARNMAAQLSIHNYFEV